MKVTRIVVLVAAYLLLLVAVLAAFALFGVQRVENREIQLEATGYRHQIEKLEEENALLQNNLAKSEQTAAELEAARTAAEQKVSDLTVQLEEVQAQLEEATRFTFDVRAVDAGTVVSADELDVQELAQYFTADKIVEGDAVYARIIDKSYQENDDIALEDLRYMKLLHYNFDHKIQVGELIVNKELVKDYQEIFLELYKNEYEIYSMYLIDDFWTGRALSSDSASIEANNTSAFCYRKSASSDNLSNHALGRAIDINPQQNPYITFDEEGDPVYTHKNARDYVNRGDKLPHMIDHDDLVFKLFAEHGFEWGGDWRSLKDYQHFEKEED